MFVVIGDPVGGLKHSICWLVVVRAAYTSYLLMLARVVALVSGDELIIHLAEANLSRLQVLV